MSEGQTEEWSWARGYLTLIAFLIVGLIGSCVAIRRYDQRSGFPSGLTYTGIRSYGHESYVTEGCAFFEYGLDARDAQSIERGGPAALKRVRLVTSNNQYSAYLSTPMPGNAKGRGGENLPFEGLFAIGAIHCIDRSNPPSAPIEVLLKEPGNFYSVSSNLEGLSVISPRRRVVLFLYSG